MAVRTRNLAYENGLKLDFDKCRYVFVYGTLKQGYGNNYLLSNAKLISDKAYTVDKFELYDVGFPYAKFSNSKDSAVLKGELYELDSIETFRDLDNLEGYPHHYRRKMIKVIYKDKDGKWKKALAWIYYTNKPCGDKITNKKFEPELRKKYLEWQRYNKFDVNAFLAEKAETK